MTINRIILIKLSVICKPGIIKNNTIAKRNQAVLYNMDN